MILIIPKIELINGQTYFLVQDYNNQGELSYCHDPIKLLKVLRKENSKTLLISDMDSINGNDNTLNLKLIQLVGNCIDIPLELEANYLDITQCDFIFNAGIYRLLLSDIYFENIELFQVILNKYKSSRISLSFNYEDGMICTNSKKYHINFDELLQELDHYQLHRILLKFDSNYADSLFPILDDLSLKLSKYNIRLTIACDVFDYKKLIELNKYKDKKIDSIVMGKPIYENSFSCQKIWRIIESDLENTD
ncbi:MAG TPA: HisA/HisF-related TIM barrel protein [Candidatus Kapabacteria bacterium]|nr:HisA/HisF-related TIM barrel protein [Candidatus Kapabacteria bacterium]